MSEQQDYQPLERIRIEGFKSIRELELELRPLNVLIGANGSGKSNFVEAFRLLNEIFNQRLEQYSRTIRADKLLYFGPKVTRQITINVRFGNESYANLYHIELVPTNSNTLIFEREVVAFHDIQHYENPYRELLGSGHQETKLQPSTTNSRIADYVVKVLKSWKIYHFHDTSSTSAMKLPSSTRDYRIFRPDASNLAAFLYWLKETQRAYYDRIVGQIHLTAPFFDDFILEPDELRPNEIVLQWKERGSNDYFDAHNLSDGTLRFICLTTLLMQPELPSIVLIDEPELGLHPFAINQLAGMLRFASTRTQVIVSTQSVPLINQLAPEDVIVVDRKQGQSVFRRLESSELELWSEEYGIGDLWEKNIIGGRPRTWEPMR